MSSEGSNKVMNKYSSSDVCSEFSVLKTIAWCDYESSSSSFQYKNDF